MAINVEQIMEMKKELEAIKKELEIEKLKEENEKLKKENGEMREVLCCYGWREEEKPKVLLCFDPTWSDFEGNKLTAWKEYVESYDWAEELQIRQEEFEEEYESEEEEEDEESDED